MGGHGHAMGAPRPGLEGIAEQIDAVGKRGMGSTTCMLPMVGHKHCTGVSKATQGSALVVHKCVQAAQGNTRQRIGSTRAVRR